MKRKMLVLAVLISLASAGVYAGTQSQAHHRRGFGGLGLVQLMMDVSDLNITAEQKTAIRSVLHKHRNEAKTLFKKLNDYRVELRDIIKNSPYDEAAIRTSVRERSGVEGDLAVLRGRISAEVKSILTPEQKAKIEAIQTRFDRFLKGCPERLNDRLNESQP